MRDDFARLASPRRLCTPRRPPTTPRRYNQIDALLKATVDPRGDVDGPDGYSPYPGSINQLIFALAPYAEQLDASGALLAAAVACAVNLPKVGMYINDECAKIGCPAEDIINLEVSAEIHLRTVAIAAGSTAVFLLVSQLGVGVVQVK